MHLYGIWIDSREDCGLKIVVAQKPLEIRKKSSKAFEKKN